MKILAVSIGIIGLVFANIAHADTGYLVAKNSKGSEIQGESVTQGFVGQIAVSDFVFDSEFKYPNAAASKFSRPNPIVTFTTTYSKAVPPLLAAASNGENFPEFKFSAVVQGTQGLRAFAVYTFKNVHIKGIKLTHNIDSKHKAEISILYQSVTVSYTPQTKTGGLGSEISGVDNVVQ